MSPPLRRFGEPIQSRALYRPFYSRPSHHLNSISRPLARPQIPFLSTSHYQPGLTARLLSTETKKNLSYQAQATIYYTAIGWTLFAGGIIIYSIFHQDVLDRRYPSPSQWGFFTKMCWRKAQDELGSEGHGTGTVDWGVVGTSSRECIFRLEDDKGVKKGVEYDETIPGLPDKTTMHSTANMPVAPMPDGSPELPSRIGADISGKDLEWRSGYFEAVMMYIKAAEMFEGFMTHIPTRATLDPQFVRSENNPFPRALPPNKRIPDVPEEKDCVRSFSSPQFLYVRLLSTKGLHRKQQMEAGIAYALYLEGKGDRKTAEDLLKWSRGLAMEGVAMSERTKILDLKTGVIKNDTPIVTPNILTASEALASCYARSDRISDALSIYLSVLRARRAAPLAPKARLHPKKTVDYSLHSAESVFNWLKAVPTGDAHYPDPSERFARADMNVERDASSICEEAALMAYVGEILFARGGRKNEGLNWTKEATTLAELGRPQLESDQRLGGAGDPALDVNDRKKCQQCLRTGLKNWVDMTRTFADELEAVPAASQSRTWSSLLWGGSSQDGMTSKEWREEQATVQRRLSDYEARALNERLNTMIKQNSSWTVV